jgi:hypothetical protein
MLVLIQITIIIVLFFLLFQPFFLDEVETQKKNKKNQIYSGRGANLKIPNNKTRAFVVLSYLIYCMYSSVCIPTSLLIVLGNFGNVTLITFSVAAFYLCLSLKTCFLVGWNLLECNIF